MMQDVEPTDIERAVFAGLLTGLDRQYRDADEAAATAVESAHRAAAERRRLACRRRFDAVRAEMAQRGLSVAEPQAAEGRDSAA
ncbi:hypothetical protein D8770_28550 [Methylobacterium sp. DB1607]|nr:hypothetical protein [Methylobacterium sp. DB1607]